MKFTVSNKLVYSRFSCNCSFFITAFILCKILWKPTKRFYLKCFLVAWIQALGKNGVFLVKHLNFYNFKNLSKTHFSTSNRAFFFLTLMERKCFQSLFSKTTEEKKQSLPPNPPGGGGGGGEECPQLCWCLLHSQMSDQVLFPYLQHCSGCFLQENACVGDSLILSIAKFLRAPILKSICEWLFLKMCLWNWEELKFIYKEFFNLILKNRFFQHQYQK